ncbi:hypothetical protein [Aurantiacibacter sp. D1-12]|uniref:hypothetical protein n=1 Tax=Aurantiacibacter sp. D1-12 TaxID=2993658 RepID=UPI00237CBE1E|nr:hypothetical protein [Aurantiacibacter sp. D1-12]MDE1467813.1 hypothetical protein [Aurantiacibacter sp. D1-12]
MSRLSLTTAAIALAAAASPAAAQEAFSITDTSGYLMEADAEVAMARSAAPAHISDDASVLTLSADGTYQTAEEGSNGWTCFVGRSWTGPAPYVDGRRAWQAGHFHAELRAPQCFNAEATGSHLAMHRISTYGFMNGADSNQVDMMIGNALASGAIQPPEHGAMSYMYSPQQILQPGGQRFFPHLMLYMPYATQDDFGPRDANMTVPMVTDAGSIFATTVIMSPLWSDGTPVQ